MRHIFLHEFWGRGGSSDSEALCYLIEFIVNSKHSKQILMGTKFLILSSSQGFSPWALISCHKPWALSPLLSRKRFSRLDHVWLIKFLSVEQSKSMIKNQFFEYFLFAKWSLQLPFNRVVQRCSPENMVQWTYPGEHTQCTYPVNLSNERIPVNIFGEHLK